MRKMGIALVTLTMIVSCSSEAVVEQAATTAEQHPIVGKWQFTDAEDQVMEFTAAGQFTMTGAKGHAKYEVAEGDILVIIPADSNDVQRFKAVVSANDLTLTDVEESEPAAKIDGPKEALKLKRAK